MSALLQGDITDDAAANAYLDYLTRLEEVAKLEPCGLYHCPQTSDENEISYVVARTAGAHRKYYFRTKENASWGPWTEVKIDCEDMPITPIVWNGRLFLFWLKIFKRTSPQQIAAHTALAPDNSIDSSSPVVNLSLDNLQAFAQAGAQTQLQNAATVHAVLCWSEFYNGKWQPTKTSDVNRPTSLGNFPLTGDESFDVDRNLLRIVPVTVADNSPFDIPPEALILAVRDPIHTLDAVGGGGFVLYNTHSLPVRIEAFMHARPPIDISPGGVEAIGRVSYLSDYLVSLDQIRTLAPIAPYTGANAVTGPHAVSTFSISYWTRGTNGPPNYTRQIENLMQFNLIPRYVEAQPGSADAWDAPFFFEDRRNLFYVITNATLGTIQDFTGFGILSTDPGLQATVANIPPLVLPEQRAPSPERDPILTGSGRDGGALTVQSYLSGSITVRVAIGSVTPVPYRNRQISLSGSSAAPGSTP
jgi:Neuraminidase-like domain